MLGSLSRNGTAIMPLKLNYRNVLRLRDTYCGAVNSLDLAKWLHSLDYTATKRGT